MNSHSLTADLLADADAWITWAPRPEIAPRFAMDGDGATPCLVVSGGGSPLACGCWRRSLPALRAGRRYRIEAGFQTAGAVDPGRSVWALVTRGGETPSPVMELAHVGGEGRMVALLGPDADVEDAELRLYLAWSAEGSVRWTGASSADVTEEPVVPRIARLAAVSGKPRAPRTPEECLRFYGDRLDAIGPQGLDLVCLPEVINADGLRADRRTLAEPIPGPSTGMLAEKARAYRLYIGASLLERDGDATHNTAVLLDREGRIAGKYHKVQLTLGEGLLSGHTPGETYPVFQTDFGAVGFMICYDAHYPEVARILAVEGADVILNPNMGDAREGGSLWEPCVRTRALDNGVHVVAAVNSGRSCIVSPRGEVLAMAGRAPGAAVSARCDLDLSLRDFTGRPIGKRYLRLRRADTYAPLLGRYAEREP